MGIGNGFRYLCYIIVTLALCSTMAWGGPIQLKQGCPVCYTDLLLMYNRGETVKNPFTVKRQHALLNLPDEEAGEILIFRSFNRVSFGLVLRATQALHVHDSVAISQDV